MRHADVYPAGRRSRTHGGPTLIFAVPRREVAALTSGM